MEEKKTLGGAIAERSSAWLAQVERATRWKGLGCENLALGLIRIDLSFESVGDSLRMDGLWPSSAIVAAPMELIGAVFANEGLSVLGGGLDYDFLGASMLEAIFEANKGSQDAGAEICESLAFAHFLRNRSNYKQAGLGELVHLDALGSSAMLVGSATAAPVSEVEFMGRWNEVIRSILTCLGPSAFVHMGKGFAPHLPSWTKAPDIWRAWPDSLGLWKEIHLSMMERATLSEIVHAGNYKAAAPRI